ncbi:unnamed protein product [Oppiella nova]|uniref:Cytochrome P450 n=1 Tax=Oppiella nova TaxID=334625 RepID=A0A7R9QR06_9ACAR|nr:unnamed protein product [Oppiella nova]CAG2172429.1 unnamed protein product [Oppiella nova]
MSPCSIKITFACAARDEDWKRVRDIASPTFTSGKMRKMYALINHCGQEFIDSLDKDVSNGMNEIELKRVISAYTMDVIASCAFSTKINTYADPNNPFTTKVANISNAPNWKRLLQLTLPTFIVSSNIYRKHLSTGGSDAVFFMDFSRSLMKKRRDNKEKYNDFLQLLMNSERSDGNEAHHVNEGKDEITADAEAFTGVLEKKLTEEQILNKCFSFFMAGYEGVATALSFCTYELALNPTLQDRLYEEIKGVFNEKGEMDYSVLSRLPFIDALLTETLRHYSPALRLERQTMEDVTLGDTGVKIEKGVIVEIPIYAIHHDPDHYPDPFTFNPDRFMPENRDHIKPYTYLPFGSGPRNCIGMRFALLEAKLALAKISQKFRFSRVTDTDVPVIYTRGGFLLQVKPLVVGIQKR